MNKSLKTQLQTITLDMMNALVRGEYELLKCPPGRGTVQEIVAAIREYGRTPVSPTEEAVAKLAVYPESDATDSWMIEMPFWTREEGESDLWLYAEVHRHGNELVGYVDYVRVP